MSYVVLIVSSAEKELDHLPPTIRSRILLRILSLGDNPRPRGIRKLVGREEYRLRVGDYRVLFLVDDKTTTVTIVAVGHRREVYD